MEIKIISDGTKEGTKVSIDGEELTTTHWRRLTWEFDFLFKKWTIEIDNHSFGNWPGGFEPKDACVDISMEVEQKGEG